MRWVSFRFGLLGLLAVGALGCAESLAEPPDLSDRLAPYQEGPTTDIPLQEVVDTILLELERAGLADALAGVGIIIGEVSDAIGLPETFPPDIDPGTNPREALQILEGRFFVDLIAEVTHICEGHDPDAAPDADVNGTLKGSARITESGFEGVFWGELDTCRFREESIDLGLDFNTVILDGPAAVWFLDPLGFDTERDYLFVFDGLAIFNDILVLDGSFDYLFQREVGITVRVPTQDGGRVFLFQPADNPNALELRTLTETWTCDLSAQQCSSTDGTQVSW